MFEKTLWLSKCNFSPKGNCWFLAAVGALTFQKPIMQKVFPDGQSFEKDYVGIFHFRVGIPLKQFYLTFAL